MMRYTILLLMFPLLATAEDSNMFNSSGKAEFFISQGVIKTSDNNVAGNSKNISFDKRELGAIGSYQVNDYLDFRGMLIYEDYGTRYNDNPHVEYALVDAHTDDVLIVDSRVGFRAGRVKLTMGLFNDKRSNPTLREMDFPPQSLYREQLKHSAVSGDGVQLYFSKKFNDFDFDFEASKIKAEIYPQEDATNVLLNIPLDSGNFSNGSVTSFHAAVKIPTMGLVFKYDNLDLNFEYLANDNSPVKFIVPSGNLKTRIEYFSVRKYFENFDITGEMVHISRRGELWAKVLSDSSYGDPYGFNLVGRYRVNDWTFVTGYNVWYTDINDRNGEKHERKTGVASHRYYQHDLNLGVKYKFDSNWTGKIEFHKIRGTNTLSIIENPDMNAMNPNWHLISTSLTYKF